MSAINSTAEVAIGSEGDTVSVTPVEGTSGNDGNNPKKGSWKAIFQILRRW
jgi:hypothetical protein